MTPASLTGELLDRLHRHVVSSTSSTSDISSTSQDVRSTVERARVAQTAWAATDFAEREAIFERFHRLLLGHRDEVVDPVQAETGKARRDAFEELGEPIASL